MQGILLNTKDFVHFTNGLVSFNFQYYQTL